MGLVALSAQYLYGGILWNFVHSLQHVLFIVQLFYVYLSEFLEFSTAYPIKCPFYSLLPSHCSFRSRIYFLSIEGMIKRRRRRLRVFGWNVANKKPKINISKIKPRNDSSDSAPGFFFFQHFPHMSTVHGYNRHQTQALPLHFSSTSAYCHRRNHHRLLLLKY